MLPNLYHGSPIRIYGRYRRDGESTIALNANVQGLELKQKAELVFPENDPDNPEIERMWAWKRIDQLLKKADRTGSRGQVIDEIIRLGEGYSIVTEYTSFLVLENDNEYKRWKIERRNSLRMNRDRRAQAQRMKQLDKIRNKAVADIGPQSVVKKKATPQPHKRQKASLAPKVVTQKPEKPNRQQWDFNMGSGPVGPLFIAVEYWLRRRKLRTIK